MLRGLIKCGICGLNYSGTAYHGPGGKPKAYYVCNGKTTFRGPIQGRCPTKNVPQQWIEDIVWNDCVRFIMTPGEAVAELAATMEERKSHREDTGTELNTVLAASQEKDTEKQSILDLFRKRIINSVDVETQLQKISLEKLRWTQLSRH